MNVKKRIMYYIQEGIDVRVRTCESMHRMKMEW